MNVLSDLTFLCSRHVCIFRLEPGLGTLLASYMYDDDDDGDDDECAPHRDSCNVYSTVEPT